MPGRDWEWNEGRGVKSGVYNFIILMYNNNGQRTTANNIGKYSRSAMYIHTYMHTYIHTYIHIYIHTYLHTYIHTCIHAYIHTRQGRGVSRFVFGDDSL